MPDEVLHGLPTKEFFVRMLTRDIGLNAAIMDLVDNSVDAARASADGPELDKYSVQLHASSAEFSIEDNCGGMSFEMAQNYAFHFGRPRDFPDTPGSIGQFGVGMKRALFKLGDWFEVMSTTAASRFVVQVDVKDWLRDPEDWDFPVLEHSRRNYPEDVRGTRISVRELHSGVATELGSSTFATRLSDELTRRHEAALGAGLSLSINGVPTDVRRQILRAGDGMLPGYETHAVDVDGERVDVAIYVGLAKSEPRLAGWYVYCNGRLVLDADQTSLTGWGDGDGKVIPKYHNQFSRFRGYVFFSSRSAEALPWNTTKTGLDTSAIAYRAIYPRLIATMRPVITFLNALDAELDQHPDGDGTLARSVESARDVRLAEVHFPTTFQSPRPVVRPREPEMGNINFRRPAEQIRTLMRFMGVTSYRQVGERAFDHYLEVEAAD